MDDEDLSCPQCGFSQSYSEWSDDMNSLSEVECPECEHISSLPDYC